MHSYATASDGRIRIASAVFYPIQTRTLVRAKCEETTEATVRTPSLNFAEFMARKAPGRLPANLMFGELPKSKEEPEGRGKV